MQYLVVYGASLVAEDYNGRTSAQLATLRNKPAWAQRRVWLVATAGYRLYKEAAFLLRQGKVDPDDTATTTVKDIMAAVATSRAKPVPLPWQNVPPVCRATVKLLVDATRGWHRTTHWLHHNAVVTVRDAVVAVLVVVGRLQSKGALPAEASSNAGAATADSAVATAQVPLLPIEVWLFAMRFFPRSWWAVEGV